MKKLTAILLCVITLAGMTVPAYAVEDTTYQPSEAITETTTLETQPATEAASIEATEPTISTEATEPSTAEEPQYSGIIGYNLNYNFNADSGKLTISGDGESMLDFTQGRAPWYSYASKITGVEITAKNLKRISSYVFENIKGLKEFTVNSKISEVGAGAFKDTGLTKITFESGKTAVADSADTIPKSAQIRCYNPSFAYDYAKKYDRKLYVFVSGIFHDVKSEILMTGEKLTVSSVVTPADASNKKITWYSSDKKVATVSSKGVVKAKKKGKCFIYAVSKENDKVKSGEKVKILVTDYKFTSIIEYRNNCYKEHTSIAPKGIVVHSTGVNNTNAYRYAVNWNTAKPGGREVAVHGFLGKGKNGKAQFYQTLPFTMACWGVGGGSKGSYNYNPGYIQFECCEDSKTSRSYFKEIYNQATDLCAYLCLKYNFSYKTVVSHCEAHKLGYGSNHGDPDHWFKRFGYSMSKFRKTVKQKIYKIDSDPDLKSGYENPKHTLTSDASIYSKHVADEYGTSSKVKAELKKGDEIEFLYDCDGGWSKVKYGSKKGYIRNDSYEREYLSNFYKIKLKRAAVCYSKPSTASKYKVKALAAGKKLRLISKITKGKKKGWSFVKAGKKEYYIKSKCH